MPKASNSDEIEFSEWRTPLSGSRLEIAEVCYLPNHRWDEAELEATLSNSIAGQHQNNDLTVRVYDHDSRSYFRIMFEEVGAFRVLDEHGLIEIEAAAKSQQRSLESTFKVRNHKWSRESLVSFSTSTRDNWAFLIRTDFDCVEILSRNEPLVEPEL